MSGLGASYGTFIRRDRLCRGWSHHCSHRPECRHWFLSRISSREENGKSSEHTKSEVPSSINLRVQDSLRALSSPSAAVIRDGHVVTIPSGEVVPGDLVQIKTGDTVPADLRLIDGMNLECDEKILTGEAMPVAKDFKIDFSNNTEFETGVGDRLNMAYSSSTVTMGRAKGIVVFTGMYTEIGKIAESMQGKSRKANRSLSRKKGLGSLQPAKGVLLRIWDGIGQFLGLTVGTPLQKKLSKLAYVLFGCAILLAIIVFGVNRFNVTNEVAIYAISTGTFFTPTYAPRD